MEAYRAAGAAKEHCDPLGRLGCRVVVDDDDSTASLARQVVMVREGRAGQRLHPLPLPQRQLGGHRHTLDHHAPTRRLTVHPPELVRRDVERIVPVFDLDRGAAILRLHCQHPAVASWGSGLPQRALGRKDFD
jgi:hypothetical protein